MKRRTKKEKNSLSSELPELCIPPGCVCCSTRAAAARNGCGEPAAAARLKGGLWPTKRIPPLSLKLHLLAVASSSVHTYSAFFPQIGYTRKAKAAVKGQVRSNGTWMQTTPEICCILLSCQGSGALRLLAGSSQSSVRMDEFCILLSLGGKYVVPQELHQFWKLL